MKVIISIITLLLICSICHAEVGISKNIKHQIQKRPDGGYTMILSGSIRHLSPITSEGVFPKQAIHYQIELKGEGKDWSYRNQPGYYYSYPDNIECRTPSWDMGYAWIDKNRQTIYLNFYWVESPDSVKSSVINGSYKIE